jgi:uncharacterized protein (DUF427 family)
MAVMNTSHRGGRKPRRAVAGDTVVADSAETIPLEGNYYFPPETVDWSKLEPSSQTSVCAWKGVAKYYDVLDGERRLPNAAWVYEEPSSAAADIKGHIAFWHGVTVERTPDSA